MNNEIEVTIKKFGLTLFILGWIVAFVLVDITMMVFKGVDAISFIATFILLVSGFANAYSASKLFAELKEATK